MLAGYLLGLREGLEAALIIGIVLGALRKLQRPELRRPVWLGLAAAIALSALIGAGLNAAGVALEGRAEEVFEGLTMLLAAGVLTWMIFWMQTQGRYWQTGIEAGAQRAISTGHRWGLFSLALVAVLREGLETALFLTAAALTSGPASFLGGLLGLLSAALLGWALFAATIHLDVRKFFGVSGILLLVFAAGLVAHGVHEFVEAGWIPAIVEEVWNTSRVLDEASPMGRLVTALFGYNANPSLIEVLAYVGYVVVAWLEIRRRSGRPLPKAA